MSKNDLFLRAQGKNYPVQYPDMNISGSAISKRFYMEKFKQC